MAELAAIAALLAVLAVALTRPRGIPEAAVAVPAAALLVLLGVLTPAAALDELRRLAPTVGFLAAVLVLAAQSDRAGLFAAAGRVLVRGSAGSPRRLLRLVFLLAALTTAVLSLDATVVLLTPVVFDAAAALRVRARPQVYACTHLANSGSLLLPVSNLTNLLAFAASGLSFGRFALLMAAPQLVAIAGEYAVLRWVFRADLATPPAEPERPVEPTGAPPRAPAYAVGVLALTLLGFAVSSSIGIAPAWVAAAGALLLAIAVRPSPRSLLASASPGFLIFVLGLGLVVRAVTDHGVGRAVDALVPGGSSLPTLLGVAVLAAALANLLNNLPALLLLLPAVAPSGPGPVLALLIGVNVGPNLTYVGSLATLLWRRIMQERDAEPAAGEFLRFGALSVPLVLVGSVLALRLALALVGGGP